MTGIDYCDERCNDTLDRSGKRIRPTSEKSQQPRQSTVWALNDQRHTRDPSGLQKITNGVKVGRRSEF